MIVQIDMHIRDQRVLSYITEQVNIGRCNIPTCEIADEFKCHYLTARAIVIRLERAGHITIDRRVRKRGYIYKVVA